MTYIAKTVNKEKIEQKFIETMRRAFLVDMIERETNPTNREAEAYRTGRQNALYQALELAELNQDMVATEAWKRAKQEFDAWKIATQE